MRTNREILPVGYSKLRASAILFVFLLTISRTILDRYWCVHRLIFDLVFRLFFLSLSLKNGGVDKHWRLFPALFPVYVCERREVTVKIAPKRLVFYGFS